MQDILAPLLHVNELRRHGVTLHMLLDAERQPIPDVPAVYFVQVRAAVCGCLAGQHLRRVCIFACDQAPLKGGRDVYESIELL